MRNNIKIAAMAGAVILTMTAVGLTGCGEAKVINPGTIASKADGKEESKVSGNLTLNGSTSMAEVCQALGERFVEKYPQVKMDKSGSGSGEAASSVNNGTAVIGDLSRKLKDSEDPEAFDIYTIAIDGIAIVVNKNNKISGLTSEEVGKIFKGEINNWSQLGGENKSINVIGRESASGTRDGFESIFKVKDTCRYSSELTSTGAVKTKVASDADAIGYISLGNKDDSVVALKIDGYEASVENIKNNTYKSFRPFIEISRKNTEDELVKAWFDFIYSDEGAQVIKECKLIPTDRDGNVK